MSTTASTSNNGRSLNIFLGVALAVILIVVLVLPPINLFSRISKSGMETIAEATSGDVTDPDGTQVAFPAYGVPGSFKASLSSVPQERFLQGTGGDDARAAAEALPESLLPRSPLYDLTVEGQRPPLASLLTIPIPNESEPYRTLDLYEWTGDQWRFMPNHESRDDDKIYSELAYVPAGFMVMQTYASPPTAAAVLPVGEQLPDAGRDALTEVSPYGYNLSGDGSIEGSIAVQASAGGSYGVAPVLRNWTDDGVVRTDLLDNLLISPDNQANHLESIRALVVGNNYPGIEIDYRGLDPTLGPEFTAVITQLADMLHENNKTLAVRVEAPTQIAEDRWTTGGYDWRALSQVVDTFRIPALLDPTAYAPDGKMDALLDWAVGEVPRDKIDLVFPASSVEKAGEYLISLGYSDAMAPLLGEGKTSQPVLVPGEPIDVSMFNERLIGSLTYDDQIGMFTYNYRDNAGLERTVWIENAASLGHKLEFVTKYNLKGASLEHLFAGSYDPDIWSLVREFLAGDMASRSSDFAVAWTVSNGAEQIHREERPLDAAGFSFVPPAAEGELTFEASIVDNGKTLASGKPIAAVLATATPQPTATPEVPPTPTPSPTPDFALAIADGTVNLRSGPGTAFGTVGQLSGGESARILGKNEDGSWLQIERSNDDAWVISRLVTIQGSPDQIAIASDIPEPPQQVAAVSAPSTSRAASAPASSGPAPASTSGSGSFGYGIQVAPWDLGAVVSQVNELGFNWVKVQVPWKDVEGDQGNFGWGGIDGMVNTFKSGGLNVLLSIPKAPTWARPPGADLSVEGPPADPATFANFLGQLAGRYCGTVNAIEVWNEQNLHYEWGNQPLDPAGYMAMLKPAYRAIKAACPSTFVISGAPTPTGAPAPWAMDDFAYLEAMYQNGLKDYSDGIGAHPSGFNVSPDVGGGQAACDFISSQGSSYTGPCNSPHHSWSFRNTMEGYRNIMVKYGDTNKRIWPTEFGWATGWVGASGYEYANDNTPDEQAQWTVRAYELMKSWGWVGPAFLWNLNYGVTNPGTELAQWGIVGRPVYSALANMPK